MAAQLPGSLYPPVRECYCNPTPQVGKQAGGGQWCPCGLPSAHTGLLFLPHLCWVCFCLWALAPSVPSAGSVPVHPVGLTSNPLRQEASSDTQSRLDSPFGYLLCECSACCRNTLPQILWPEIAPFMGLHFHGSESQGLSRPSAQDFTKSDSRCWLERPWGAPVSCSVRVLAEPRALAHRPVLCLQARGSRPNLCHFAISASLFQFSLPLFFSYFFFLAM